MKWNYFRILAVAAGGVMLVTLLGAYALACSYVYLVPSLPSIEAMRNVELQVPLRVYTRSGELIAQIGEQRRIPVTYDQIPELVKHAFLAAEDERFFEHRGIDYFGVVRAVLVDVISGDKTQGASTITMQAARNMFLTLDKTARRKLQETFVTYRMEHEFTKQEIFGLYLNVIFFGQRAYGVAAAAEAFFGKTPRQARRRRGGDHRRRAQGALALQPDRRSAGRQRAPRLRAAAHARARLHRRGHRGGRQQGADAGARARAAL